MLTVATQLKGVGESGAGGIGKLNEGLHGQSVARELEAGHCGCRGGREREA